MKTTSYSFFRIAVPSLFFLLILSCSQLYGQTLLFEDFQGGFPSGWGRINNDGLTPHPNVAYVTDAWIVREDFINDPNDSVAFSTSWYTSPGTSDDWMYTPAVSPTLATTLSWEGNAPDPAYPDGYEVRVSTTFPTVGGFLANPPLVTVPAENSTWTPRSVSLAPYAGQNIFIAFRNNSNDQFLLMIDDVHVFNPSGFDALVSDVSFLSEYVQVPLSQVTPFNFEAQAMNSGTSGGPVTNVQVTVNVFEQASGFSLVHTDVVTASSSLNPGDTATATGFSPYTPGDTGVYIAQYIVSINETDGTPSNDTMQTEILITDTTLARDRAIFGQPIGGLGFGSPPVPDQSIGTPMGFVNPATLNSVTFALPSNGAAELGTQVSVDIFNYTSPSGPSGAPIASTPSVTITDTNQLLYTLPIPGGLAVGAQDYFFSIRGASFAGQTDDINFDEAVWGSTTPDTGPWTNFTSSFPGPMVIWANLGGNITTNDAELVSAPFPTPYAQLPVTQLCPFDLEATVSNNLLASTGVTVTLNIYSEFVDSTLSTSIYTDAVVLGNMSSGQTLTATGFAPFTPPVTQGSGVYVCEYVVSINEADVNAGNDTFFTNIFVNPSTQGRDRGIFGETLTGLGFGSPATSAQEIGTWLGFKNDTWLGSITFGLGPVTAVEIGDSVRAKVYNYSNSTGPTSQIAATDWVLVSDTNQLLYTLVFPGGQQFLPAGEYFLSVCGAAFVIQTDNILSDTTIWGTSDASVNPWADFTAGFPGALLIWADLTGPPTSVCGHDGYEPNDSQGAATNLFGGSLAGFADRLICPSGDSDWAFFDVQSTTNVQIDLNGLPADYDLELFDGGSMIGSSINGGTAAEQIQITLGPGTYHTHVFGVGGASSAQNPYNLTVTFTDVPPGGSGTKPNPIDPVLKVQPEDDLLVYPNPAANMLTLSFILEAEAQANVNVLDIYGKRVMTKAIRVAEGLNKLPMDVSGLSSGTYFVELTANDKRYVKEVLIISE